MNYTSNIKLNNSTSDLNKISNSEKIIIFGTGNFGKIVLKALTNINKKIEGFADNNRNNWGKKVFDYEIFSEEKIKNNFKNHLLLPR